MKAGREPEVMGIDLKTWDGKEVLLENDGILTMRTVGEDDLVSILQTRSAFREGIKKGAAARTPPKCTRNKE